MNEKPPNFIFAECPDNVLGRNNLFYIFSDKQATADNALMVCDNAGGSLVQSNDGIVKADLIEQATSVYIPEGWFYNMFAINHSKRY